MAIYFNLLLKTKKGINIPKLNYKYLTHRSKAELKFLAEEAKKHNYPYLTYVDIYISKIKHHVKKIREKQIQEQLEETVQYNQCIVSYITVI